MRGWLAVAKQSHWSRSRGYGAEQEGEYARVSPSTKHVQSRSYGDNSHNLSTSSTGHQTMVDVPVPISYVPCRLCLDALLGWSLKGA